MERTSRPRRRFRSCTGGHRIDLFAPVAAPANSHETRRGSPSPSLAEYESVPTPAMDARDRPPTGLVPLVALNHRPTTPQLQSSLMCSLMTSAAKFLLNTETR